MKKILKNAFGFGLVEVLIAAGLAGGIALTIAKLSQDANRVTKTTETNNEINMFMTDAAYILSDKENCQNSIIGGPPPSTTPANGTAVAALKRKGAPPTFTPVAVYQSGQSYGNKLFTISSMETEYDGVNTNLKLKITRNNIVANGAKSIIKKIPLKAVVDASGNMTSCFSDTDDMVEDAAKAACTGNSAKWDDLNKVCIHDILITGANASGVCPDGQAIKAMVAGTAPNNGEPANFTCQPIFSTTCPGGQFIKGLNPDGSVNCADLTSCAPGQYLKQNAAGGLDCVDIPSCGADQVLHTKPDGSFGCSDSACGDNQYLQAINSNGAKLCKTIPNGACGSGMYVKEVKTNGDLVCEPVPSGASLPAVAYSFADGFDASSNTWSRKTIDQTAQQICDRILGATWNGTKCTLPTQSDVFAINVPALGETRGNGASGNTFTTFMCPAGYGLAAVDARTGNNWDSITFQCRDMVTNYLNQTTSPRYGGSGGGSPGMSNSRCRCPGSSFISSIYMYTGSSTDGLSGDCINKNFSYAGSFGKCGSNTGGAADTGRSICPPNSIANGAVVRYQSDRVNTVQLICQQKLTTVDW